MAFLFGRKTGVGLLCALAAALCCVGGTAANGDDAANAKSGDYWVYFGTSTGGTTPDMDEIGVKRSEGIYVGKFDASTGAVADLRLALKANNSGFIATVPEKNLLYFIGSRDRNDGGENVYACKVDPKTGDLTVLNFLKTDGSGACHVSVRPDGKFVAVANYVSGDFVVYKTNADGSLAAQTAKYKGQGSGPNKRRQGQPFGHAAYFAESNGVWRVLMCDLGSDKVYVARLNEETGALEAEPKLPFLQTPAGAGPRHLDFATAKNGDLVVYVLNELDSTLSVFRPNFEFGNPGVLGVWSTIEPDYRQKLTDEESLVDGEKFTYGNKTAEIFKVALPNGKTIVYGTNRGQNTLVAFDATATLADVPFAADATVAFRLVDRVSTQGKFPRYFMIDPTGRYLIVCNKKTGTSFVFAINQEDGTLKPTGADAIKIAWAMAGGFVPCAE
ncbi:MAG: lactonase family protein [Thermoguttaceae bacterium]|nr:lactonase family protein [Thermoguttaceae bacterium]